MKNSPLSLFIALVIGALLLKMYQHHHLLHLTYHHQRLARHQTKLLDDCLNLRKQYERIASPAVIHAESRRNGLQSIRLEDVIPLSQALAPKVSHAVTSKH